MEHKELEFVTKNIRAELNERSKDTVNHLTKTLQECIKGTRQDVCFTCNIVFLFDYFQKVYIVESAKQMAIREAILQSTFDLLSQIDILSKQEIESSISLIDKKTIQIEVCNQFLKQLNTECQPLKRSSEQWEQQQQHPQIHHHSPSTNSPLKL